MKSRHRILLIIVGLTPIAIGCAKLIVPFGYAERPIYSDAVAFVSRLQADGERDPEVIAVRYLFYGTDHQSKVPERIRLSSRRISSDTIRVRIYDPSCGDDSVYSSIDRVYLRHEISGGWTPTRVEWSHKGRGRFGWTTEPTT